MKLDTRKPLVICFFICMSLITVVIIFAQVTFESVDVTFLVPQPMRLEEQTSYEIDGKMLTTKIDIPREVHEDFVLTVTTFYQTLKVSVDDEVIYTQGIKDKGSFGTQFGMVVNRIRIPEELAAKTLTLVAVTSPQIPVKPLDIMTERAVNAPIVFITQNIYTFAFCAIACTLGLIFIVTASLLKHRERAINIRSFLALGCFVILTAVWIFSDSKLIQFVPIKTVTRFLISVGAFVLMPVPLLGYLDEVCTKRRKSLTVLMYAYMVNSIAIFALYIFAGVELAVSLVFCHILMVYTTVDACIIAYKEVKKCKNKDFVEILIGIAVLCVAALLALVLFYYANITVYSEVIQLGMTAFIVLLCINLWHRIVEVLRNNLQMETYKTMAFVDGMTNLLNRAALDRDIDEIKINLDSFKTLSFIVFDLNNLKQTNDTKGHSEGDRLIVSLAKCLQHAVDGIGNAYRVGGDEFILIALNQTKECIDDMISDIDNRIEAFNTFDETKISVAKGVAFKEISDATMQEVMGLLKQADNNMYVSKVSMHKQRDEILKTLEEIVPKEKSIKIDADINRNTILIVDDSEVNRVILSEVFCEAFCVLEANDGFKALDIVCNQRDHLSAILLDIMMPDLDGLDVLENLQASGLSEVIPIIVITSLDDPATMKRVLELGAFDIIVKPFDASVVFSRVIHAIEYTWFKFGKAIK